MPKEYLASPILIVYSFSFYMEGNTIIPAFINVQGMALPHFSSATMIYLASVLAGILFWNSVAGRYEGDRLERSLRIPAGAYFLHIHHWLYCLGFLILLHALGISNGCTDGFLTGSVIQGLTYRDWYLLVYEKSKASLIYARWRSVRSPASRFDA